MIVIKKTIQTKVRLYDGLAEPITLFDVIADKESEADFADAEICKIRAYVAADIVKNLRLAETAENFLRVFNCLDEYEVH